MAERSSKWAFIVYPDSAPEDWKEVLKYSFVKVAISPLHSPSPSGDGESEKKKHWHIMLEYDSLKSLNQVLPLAKLCNGTVPLILDNPSGYYQYMIHKNDPDKEQFINGFDSIEEFNGFDGEKYQAYTSKQLDSIFKDIIDIIEKHKITEYETLIMYLMDQEHDKTDYFRIARTNTIFFNSFLSSKRNRIKENDFDHLENEITKIKEKINHA